MAYHAFVVPAFETGRHAGMVRIRDFVIARCARRAEIVSPATLPYYRWYFRTGVVGDFEYLVRLLKPRPTDGRIGRRDIDVQRPGANIEGIIDEPGTAESDRLGGILKLGGALRIPDAYYDEEELALVEKYRDWPAIGGFPHRFQRDLAQFINLADSYQEKDAGDANSASGIQRNPDRRRSRDRI